MDQRTARKPEPQLPLLTPTPEVDEPGRLITSASLEQTFFGQSMPHKHRRAQLLYVMNGVITVEANSSVWIIPPRCAFWLPSGTVHCGRSAGHIKVGKLYIEPELAERMSDTCGTLLVRPLLRELIVHFIEHQTLSLAQHDREERLISVLIDELQSAPRETLHLPMPSDPRLGKITAAQMKDPALSLTIDEWGSRVGASSRTLSRLFLRETGTSFFRWRQRMHIGLALQHLANGERVSNIAIDLGYDSTSAFIAMFRKTVGTTPSRYFSESRLNYVEGLVQTSASQTKAPMDGRRSRRRACMSLVLSQT